MLAVISKRKNITFSVISSSIHCPFKQNCFYVLFCFGFSEFKKEILNLKLQLNGAQPSSSHTQVVHIFEFYCGFRFEVKSYQISFLNDKRRLQTTKTIIRRILV